MILLNNNKLIITKLYNCSFIQHPTLETKKHLILPSALNFTYSHLFYYFLYKKAIKTAVIHAKIKKFQTFYVTFLNFRHYIYERQNFRYFKR